jgi:regulator of replication initiation timing
MATSEDEEPLDADLLALIEENEALQAENDALRLETADHGIFFDDDAEATEEQEAAWLCVKLEALKRERESLQDFLELSHELNDLQLLNTTLREVTTQLMNENEALQKERNSLQTDSALASTVASPSRAGTEISEVEMGSHRTVAPKTPSTLGPVVPSPKAMLRRLDAEQVAQRREVEPATIVGTEQRKEMISNMIKTGLLAPAPGAVLAKEGDVNSLNQDIALQTQVRSKTEQDYGARSGREVGTNKTIMDPMRDTTMSRFARESKFRAKLHKIASIQN